AISFFDSAIKADPENGQAYAWKACTLGQSMARGFSNLSSDVLFPIALESVNTAIKLDPNDFECHRMLSAIHCAMGDLKLACEHGKRSYE
ncbi:MAG: hypothetical protein ACKVLN_13335, partial [Rhodobacterales bacterium]